jgi:hypothetical protein
MKLQGSRPSGREILQIQIRQSPENRLAFNRLAVVHGRLTSIFVNMERQFKDGHVAHPSRKPLGPLGIAAFLGGLTRIVFPGQLIELRFVSPLAVALTAFASNAIRLVPTSPSSPQVVRLELRACQASRPLPRSLGGKGQKKQCSQVLNQK